MSRGLCAFVLCLLAQALSAQASPVVAPPADPKFHAEILKLYGFQPGTLRQKEMETKSGELDAFWEKVKQKSMLGLALRRELARDDVPGFFLYDGSMLLLDLGRKPAAAKPKSGRAAADAPVDKSDAKVVIAAMARCTLKGIQQDDYLRKIHWLASEGNDTTAAALHALDEPDFQAFIRQHALMLGQDYSLIFMLLPTDEAFWLQPALERLKSEKDEKACKSLLRLIWYTATDAGDAAIKQVAEDEARPKALRDAAANFELQTTMIPVSFNAEQRAKLADLVKADVNATVAELKAARRKRMQDNISDESLGDAERLTLLIRSHAP